MTGHTDECEMMVRLLSGEHCTCGFDAAARAGAEAGA